ncbi:MAG: methyltransferase domain-containing protein [Verrucomicrobia bacterium]|nr:MAG: methyltransferase domain-containing protein [Verrucomicrobiota bacterium]
MILFRLIRHHRRHGPDEAFYRLQAEDALAWLERHGVRVGPPTRVLDLGCGTGVFGRLLLERGCEVRFADAANWLPEGPVRSRFTAIDIDRDDLASLDRHDLVICSNVLEHLAHPDRLLRAIPELLTPEGWFYLSWTNWFSPWGGHDFSPFQYFGPRLGPWLWDRLIRRPRRLEPFRNLFPVHIGPTLRRLRRLPGVGIVAVAPRYYPECSWLMRVPGLREFLAWNCAVLLRRLG